MIKVLTVAMLFSVAGSPAVAQTQGGAPIEIPLRVEGGRLMVPVLAPDGTQLEFALSTGTPPTVFSESTAALLGDQTKLTMGGVSIDDENIHTLPDEALTTGGTVIAGMVGAKTLSQFDVLVDVPGGRLVLKPIDRSVEWEGMSMSDPIRLRVYHGVLLGLDVAFNGTEYGATLDLGTPSLVVNEPVKTAMRLDAEDEGTLTLGTTDLPGLPVRVSNLPILERWDPDGRGFVIVGAPLAYDCAISISWGHRELRTCVR